MELEEYRKDGSTIWVELVSSFLRDNNLKPKGILTVTRDITERKHAEGQLQQTLERLKKAIGTTIAGIGLGIGSERSLYGRSPEEGCRSGPHHCN